MSVTNDTMLDKFAQTFRPGEIIFLEYEPGDCFYLIKSGRVKISKVVLEKEKMLDIFEPGAIFGEMAIIEDAPRSATAVAVDEVNVLTFRKENFQVLLRAQPPMALSLLKTFARRIYDQRRRLMILTLEEDDAKVLDALLMLAEQKGINTNSLEQVELTTTEEQIANWTALKLEVCKKVLGHYAKLGRIDVQPNKIVIRNINEIHRIIATKRKQHER